MTTRSVVICQVCGKQLCAVNGLHLRHHGLTCEEYRKVFPTAIFHRGISGGWNRGKTKDSDERIKHNANAISRALRGVPKSPEHRKALSIARTGKSAPNKYKGKSYENIVGSHKAREWREKLSIIHKGKPSHWKDRTHLEVLGEERTALAATKARLARRRRSLAGGDSSIETMLQLALNIANVYYRIHEPIIGQPDIFIPPNICIFADGDYWHNYPYGREYDKQVDITLESLGYVVLRFWERDIDHDVSSCISRILEII